MDNIAGMAGHGYTTTEVCALAGVTYRQLDYWCRARIVAPSIAAAAGHGSRRLFSAADVHEIARVAEIARRRAAPLADLITS